MSGSAELVRQIRGDIAQGELAERAGVARASVSRWEGGLREPSLEELRRLAKGAGKRVEISVLEDADPGHVDLVGMQLDVGPTERIRLLAGESWPAIRAALAAAATVEGMAVLVGPAGAALRGAPQRIEGAAVDLLVDPVDAVEVIAHLIDEAGAHSLGVFVEGEQHRQLFGLDAGGVLSLSSETDCDLSVRQIRERAHTMVLNEEAIGCVRVALVEDLLELAEASRWFGNGAIRSGLRAVLASGRYSTRRAPGSVEIS